MKKILVPVVAVLVATGAAFATKTAKLASVDAYRFNAPTNQCVKVTQKCNDIGTEPCIWTGDNVTHLVERESATMCGDELFRL